MIEPCILTGGETDGGVVGGIGYFEPDRSAFGWIKQHESYTLATRRVPKGRNDIRVFRMSHRSVQRRNAGFVLRSCVDTCVEADCDFLKGRGREIFFGVPPPATHRDLCSVHQLQGLDVVLTLTS